MTQAQLAEASGMPQPTIARVERGTVLPRTATLLVLLEATGHRLTVEPTGPVVDDEAITRSLRMPIPRRVRQAIGRAAKDPSTHPARILRRLRWFGVPFVLIGDLAEAAHGAPVKVRRVVEVCHASTETANHRLSVALDELGPEADAGRLRLVTRTAAGDEYDVLVRNAVRVPVDAGILIRVAALDDLIRIRRRRCTPKDQDAADVLRAVQQRT